MTTPWTIITRALLVGVLAFGACNRNISADQTTPAKAAKPKSQLADDDIQHLLYLAEDRLVIFRLHVRVDGKSYAAVSNEMLDQYFGELDTNKDGVLSGDELKALPTATSLQRSGIAGIARSFRLPTFSQNSADASPRDGKVTKKELLTYLDRIGIRPFSVRLAGSGPIPNQRIVGFGNPASPNNAGKKLFNLLDRNNDGKLSREELLAASKSLHKADLDDDETISTAELQPPQSPFLASVAMNGNTGGSADSGLFLSLSSSQSQAQMVRRLIERYDRVPRTKNKTTGSPDGKLDRKELTIDAVAFSRFDQDGDGRLDFDELRQFLRDPPPSVEIVLRFGRRNRGESLVELVRTDAGLKSLVRNVTGQLAALRLKNSQIDIGGGTADSWRANSTANLEQQFKSADMDNNGYVDKMESRRYALFVNAFDEMDADKDGKVFLKEMQAYFRRQESLAKSQTILNITDQGRDLFQILDVDRDNRLSVGELDTLAGRIDAWDNDGDRKITISEIPQQYRMSLSQGQVSNGINQFVAVAPDGIRTTLRARNNGPKWFTRMDVNQDGEVSSREFLGNPSLFKKLDKNGNGRLDADEAAAVKK